MAHNNPYASQSSSNGYRRFSYNSNANNANNNNSTNNGGSRLQPASIYHPQASQLSQQQPQNAPPPQAPPQQQPPPPQQPQLDQQQQALIADLRRQLEEKNEDNFDLSASLAAVQVETNDKMELAEKESKQQIAKLEEKLRRTQQDANRARAALKKQQQQQQQQQLATTKTNAQQSPLRQNNISSPLDPRASSRLEHNNSKPETLTCSASSPKPAVSRSNNDHPMVDADPKAHTTTATSYSSILAQKLLLELLPESHQVHALLSYAISDASSNSSHSPPQDDVTLIWNLVQQSVDCSNHQALAVLEKALLWSPQGCNALVEAAGWKIFQEEEPDENMDNNNVLAKTGSTIRFASHNNRQQARLQAIALQLKQPLGLMSSSARGPRQHHKSFSPKQQLLACQLVTKLSESIASNDNKVSLGILARLLAHCDGQTHQPSVAVLEPAMTGIVARLQAHRPMTDQVRGYDPLPRLIPAIDEEMEPVDGDDDKKTTQCARLVPTSLPLKELDPMLCEVCRQIQRLLPTSDDETATTQNDFVHQWRKAVVANACDILEGSLLPFLLDLSQEPNNNSESPSEVVVAAWQEWIPWLSGLVQDKNGRHLLRTQFPIIIATTTTMLQQKADNNGADDSKPKGVDISCSAMGVVVEIFYASAMIEQCQGRDDVAPEILSLCRTLQNQSIRCIHSWLQCYEARKRNEISFLDLVSEYLEFYKSACAWILHQGDVGSTSVDPDCVTMVAKQVEELVLDEDEHLQEREKLYKKKG
ncbi:expressed unknown protein [Seminavis robusta]|uniref:Uncharacterized protein n=1 Tax=Seminavis robusta TaxID=568900 RepID=A0A9N8HH50_9STRA|nr:expressed unknown protein [Seminavis robusta]|eukprot:Sro616_g175890.1 n/a (761) ;mRNA; f:2394-4676